jgi:hypothetical protein
MLQGYSWAAAEPPAAPHLPVRRRVRDVAGRRCVDNPDVDNPDVDNPEVTLFPA